jgi:hypothetical protein
MFRFSSAFALLSVAGLVLLLALGLAGCGGSGSSSGSSGGPTSLTGFLVDGGTLAALPGATASAQGHTATAGTGGFFVLSSLSAGNVNVTFSDPGHQTTIQSVSVPAGGLALGLVLLPPVHVAGTGDLSGQVTLSGFGVNGARVSVGSIQSITDSSGNFTLYNLPPGLVTVTGISSDGISTGTALATVVANGHVSGVLITLSSAPPPPPGV